MALFSCSNLNHIFKLLRSLVNVLLDFMSIEREIAKDFENEIGNGKISAGHNRRNCSSASRCIWRERA